MEILVAGMKAGFALVASGGVLFIAMRIGRSLGKVDAISENVVEVKTGVREFRRNNDEAHEKINIGLGNVGQRLVAVETQVANLPCNGKKPPSTCPVGGE